MATFTRNRLLALGLTFHIVYLFSIFDIYFTSPLVHGMTPHKVDAPAPADRLILFSADGLRVDKLMDPYHNATKGTTEHLAPFLFNVAKGRGSYGVSHTRVPTESRPGHVALIAGFYEDVSAVTKGWKMNPVDFDSVFNQSTHTWSFGSPDILPMFAEGASDISKIETVMYDAESEDFSRDAWHLDEFVFLKVKDMFNKAESDFVLKKQLNQKGVVIFMHLLGLDTNGHAFRPYSQEYLRNIAYVDKIINETTQIVERFYGNDGRTSYVFSADHGMSDRGVHGDGHLDNTRTPMIAWGAGIAKTPELANKEIADGHSDGFSKKWGLDRFERKDVNQADISPLMSVLLGLNLPMNSVGYVPLSYLSGDDEFKAQVMLANAKQILEQYDIKEAEKQKSRISFSPFQPLSTPGYKPIERISKARNYINMHKFSDAIEVCSDAINEGLSGLRYYQRYDWVLLRSVITFGYLGWIVYSLIFIFKHYSSYKHHFSKSSSESLPLGQLANQEIDDSNKEYAEWDIVQYSLVVGLTFIIFILLRIQESPPIYYVYVIFPLFFWFDSLRQLPSIMNALKKKSINSKKLNNAIVITFCFITLEMLVYAYHDRRIFTLFLVLLAFLWPAVVPLKVARKNVALVVGWTIFCLTTSIFTLLPVEKGENPFLCVLGGAVIVFVGILCYIYAEKFHELTILSSSYNSSHNHALHIQKTKFLFGVLTSFVALATVLVYSTSLSLANRTGLPFVNQVLSWVLFLGSLIFPVVYIYINPNMNSSQHFFNRIMVIFLSFATPLVLLTISYESLFYSSLLGVLVCWLLLEQLIYNSGDDNLLLSNNLSSSTNLSEKRRHTSGPSKPRNNGFIITELHAPSETGDITEPTSNYKDIAFLKNSNGSIENILLTDRPVVVSDLRIAVLFLMLINLAFFGTGNVASLSSFSLESVYRLITQFNPFLMATLLLYKLFIPFFAASAVFAIINSMLDLPPFCLFLVGLSTTDIMTLNFFYMVRDEGSWLDIGTSISHFCISSSFVLFSIILFVISNALTTGVSIPRSRPKLELLKKTG